MDATVNLARRTRNVSDTRRLVVIPSGDGKLKELLPHSACAHQ